MSAQTRTWLKSHVAKGLSLRRLNDLPNVDVHRAVDGFQFVNQSNVDGTENILQQFHRLSCTARGYRYQCTNGATVECTGLIQTLRRVPADDLGNVRHHTVRVARIFALRRIGQVEIPAGTQTRTFFQHRTQLVLRSAGIGGRFQYNQHARTQVGSQCAPGFQNIRQIRLSITLQRSGYADY